MQFCMLILNEDNYVERSIQLVAWTPSINISNVLVFHSTTLSEGKQGSVFVNFNHVIEYGLNFFTLQMTYFVSVFK
jgi:hypothetical protein